MKTVQIRVVQTQYNVMTGFAWFIFWMNCFYFGGILLNMWPFESTTAQYLWIASALRITFGRPFRQVHVHSLTLPVNDLPPTQ